LETSNATIKEDFKLIIALLDIWETIITPANLIKDDPIILLHITLPMPQEA